MGLDIVHAGEVRGLHRVGEVARDRATSFAGCLMCLAGPAHTICFATSCAVVLHEGRDGQATRKSALGRRCGR